MLVRSPSIDYYTIRPIPVVKLSQTCFDNGREFLGGDWSDVQVAAVLRALVVRNRCGSEVRPRLHHIEAKPESVDRPGRCRTAGSDIGWRWPSRLVATAAEKRLSFRRNFIHEIFGSD